MTKLIKVLLPLLLLAAVILGEAYVALDNATYDQPVSLTLRAEPEFDVSRITVKKLAFRSTVDTIEHYSGHEWRNETGKIRTFWIEGPHDILMQIQSAEVQIGGHTYRFEKKQLNEVLSGDELRIGALLPREYGYVPWRFGELINVSFAQFMAERAPAIVLFLLFSLIIGVSGANVHINRQRVLAFFLGFLIVLAALTILDMPRIYIWLLVLVWLLLVVEVPKNFAAGGISVGLPVALLLVVLFTVAVFLPGLGYKVLYTDEVFSYKAAQFILESGEPAYPETGYYYGRASLFHHLTAGTMALFGVNLWAARILNILWLAGTALLLYLFLKDKGTLTAFAGSALFLLAPATVDFGREVRMYPMFAFWFTLALISLYKALMLGNSLRSMFNWKWATVFVLSSLVALNTQNLAVYMLFGFLVFTMISVFQNRENRRKWIVVSLLVVGIIFLGAWLRYDTWNIYAAYLINPAADWAEKMDRDFFYYLEKIPFLYPLFFLVFIPWSAVTLYKRNRFNTFVFSMVIGVVLFLSLTTQKSFRYMFAVTPLFAYITADFFSERTLYIFFKQKAVLISTIAVSTLVLFQFAYAKPELTRFENDDYRQVINYLRQTDRPLITDLHAFWTLYGYDIKSAAVVAGPHEEWRLTDHSGSPSDRTGVDGYYLLENVCDAAGNFSKSPLIIVESWQSRDWLEEHFEQLPEFEKPAVFIGECN